LVMGHNLDDEAATLFSNVLQWNADYLGRQRPVLPATEHGLARKVKPLIRVAERETAAYAVLSGIEYEVEECPMAAGNTLNRYKEWLNRLEEQSPGIKASFLFGFLERGAQHFAPGEGVELLECSFCGQPTTGEVCAFCKLQKLTISRRPEPTVRL
jgi:tRNA-5-methyluridine54 2-sulfurtransferase